MQRYRNEKKGWEGKSFHVNWKSISLIHGHKDAFKTVTQPISGGSESGNGSRSSNSILRLKKLRETQPKKPYRMVNGWAGQPVE